VARPGPRKPKPAAAKRGAGVSASRQSAAAKPAAKAARKRASLAVEPVTVREPGSTGRRPIEAKGTKPAQAGKRSSAIPKPTESEAALVAASSIRSSTDPPPRPPEKRNIGLRGAAPWVARHAAKHAAELRARNAEPPPPGSARATLRVPPEAESIKAHISQLHQQVSKIRSLSRRLDKNFYEVGLLLAEVQLQDLHVAKGYSTFEAFLDRDVDIGRATALRLIRITHTFLRDTAYDFGIERLTSALAALDGEVAQGSPSQPSNRSFSSPGLPARPPIRFNE